MLRVIDKEKRVLILRSPHVIISQSIKTDIMITNGKNKRYNSVKFGVDCIEHRIELIPTKEAAPHGIIINSVSTQNDHIWLEIYQIRCHFLALCGHAQIATHCHLDLLGIVSRNCLVIGPF
jgi:hypothetical protein